MATLVSNTILFYVFWSSRKNTTPLFDPFEVNFSVTEASLLKAGYEYVPVDVPMLGLQRGDTSINYQLYDVCNDAEDIIDIRCENKGVSDRFCTIYLDKMDSAYISKLVDRYDARIISNFTWRQDYSDSTWLSGSFFVQHKFSQVIFNCSIDKCYREGKENKYELSIVNSFPWTAERIEEELESRRVGTEYYKFNDLLGKSKDEVGSVLFKKFDIDRTILMSVDEAIGVDPIKKVFETKKHKFMLYFVSDTLKYIHVTFWTSTRGVLDHMKAAHKQDSTSISDRFLSSQIKKKFVTGSLFKDKQKAINYLVLEEDDPQYEAPSYEVIVFSPDKSIQKK